jgi:hypothetical protein
VDFRLVYGLGAIEAVFSAPTCFAVRTAPPSHRIPTGPVAAVGFGATIGERIVSPVSTNHYAWSEGSTNLDEATMALGEREANVFVSQVIPLDNPPVGLPGATSDVAGKEGVMAVKFYLLGLAHYGYIQFDFRTNATTLGGDGGLIRGWAYETDPEAAIVARPIGELLREEPAAPVAGVGE